MSSSDTATAELVDVTVVIASGAGGEFLPRCLESLRDQAEGSEVLVIDRCGPETVERIRAEFPFVTAVPAHSEHRPSVPELRQIGVERAKGQIVAIIEEHCVAPPHWLETIRSSFRDGVVAVGGPILAQDYTRTRDWVVYFSEYHSYLPPWIDGPRYELNGANIAYRRDALLSHRDILGAGYWEVVLHPGLATMGDFYANQKMGVYHTGPFDYGYYLEQRYLLSRVWGGSQRDRVSPGKRVFYLLAAPLLPYLLLARIVQRVFGAKYHVRRLLVALPLLLPVAYAYVLGEWLGYLVGVGTALVRVE